MSDNLYFEPDYYKITKIIEPNLLKVEDTWVIQLKDVDSNTQKGELQKFLKEGYIVRIIPRSRNNEAFVISDVWLGNTHINRQFSNYKKT